MFVARFERVSEGRFNEDLGAVVACYSDVRLPERATRQSAGYDFYAPYTFCIKSGEMVKVKTGVRCYIADGYVLMLHPRSSLGFKYQLMLANTTGIIDADYYGAENEGHIIIALVNNGDKDVIINKGDRFAQGVFLAYYLAEEEEVDKLRVGGFGSSDIVRP